MVEEQHFWVGVNLSADGSRPEGVYTPAAFEVVDGSTVRTWGSPALDPVLREAIGRALESLRAAREAMLLGVTPDAVLTEAEEAMAAIGELTGASIREDITNRIFARFCVGK